MKYIIISMFYLTISVVNTISFTDWDNGNVSIFSLLITYILWNEAIKDMK